MVVSGNSFNMASVEVKLEPTTPWNFHLCRVCGGDLKFGQKGQVFNLMLNKELKAALEAITLLPVAAADALQSVCRCCKHLLEKYERARVSLENIVKLIRELCEQNTATQKPTPSHDRKRIKEEPVFPLVSQPASQKQTGKPIAVVAFSPDTVKIKEEPVFPLVSQPASQKQTGKPIAVVAFSPDNVKSAVQRLAIERQEPRKSTQPIPTPAVLPLTAQNIVKPIPTPAAVLQPIQSTSTQNMSPSTYSPAVIRKRKKERKQHEGKIIKVRKITQKYSKSRILRGPWQKLGEVLIRGRHEQLPKVVMAVSGVDAVVDKVLNLLKKECMTLCSTSFNSVLRQTNPQALNDFKWDDLIAEWRANAPIFLKFLECSGTVYDETLNVEGLTSLKKHKRTTKARTMAMAGATLLRSRKISMSAPMYRNTFVLRRGGAKKRCIQQLSRIGVCMSPRATLTKLKDMGISWDKKILQWKDKKSGCQTDTAAQCTIEETLTDESIGQQAGGDTSQSGVSEMSWEVSWDMTDSESGEESREESPCQSDEEEVSSSSSEQSAMSDIQPLSECELTSLDGEGDISDLQTSCCGEAADGAQELSRSP